MTDNPRVFLVPAEGLEPPAQGSAGHIEGTFQREPARVLCPAVPPEYTDSPPDSPQDWRIW